MATGKHGPGEITITYDDGPGGSPRLITGFVLTFGGVKITSKMQASTAYGMTVTAKLPTGISELADIPITGFWDDTTVTGPHVVFLAPDTSPQAATRTLAIVFGNAKTWTSEGYLVDYEVIGKVNALTEFKATLCQNSGAWS
jgi:hypothetical protein